MSLQVTSESVNHDATGYKQVTSEASSGNAQTGRTSKETAISANERDFKTSGTSARESRSKAHIAFELEFAIKTDGSYPFNPAIHC